MAKRGKSRPRCLSCGKFKNNKGRCTGCNSHHTRPRSRGGNDGVPNEVDRDKDEHSAWHNLHINLRPGEVVRLILFDWEIHNPYREKRESYTEMERLAVRVSSWNLLYGSDATKRSVVEVIIKKFTRTGVDRRHIKRVLREALDAQKINKTDFNVLTKLIDSGIKE